jgi:hypothetical protein
MSEAMIKNPQFQIFSITEDERESYRTSIRESMTNSMRETDHERGSIDSVKNLALPNDI